MALLKVGVLVIKQLTKPLAKRAKSHAKASPVFASQCIRVGNVVNQFTHYVNVRMLGGRILKVKPLDDAVAVERGAEVLSEGLIIGVGALLITLEYARKDMIAAEKDALKKRNERRKEKLRQLELNSRFAELRQEVLNLRNEVAILRNQQSSEKVPETEGTSWFFWRSSQ